MSDMVELHLHTHYSTLDGLSTPEEYMQRASEIGMTSLAITDHGTPAGHRNFQIAAEKAGIKPILGVEAYISSTTRFDRRAKAARSDGTSVYNHIILLAQNEAGKQNLNRLNEAAWTEGFYSKPRIDTELLFEHNEGIIVLSGCLNGLISRALEIGDESEAETIAAKYRDVFGDRFFVEVQGHNPPELNAALLSLADRMNIRSVATSDCHYSRREDGWIEDALLILSTKPKVKAGTTYEESLKFKTVMERFNYLYPDRVMTFKDIEVYLRDRPGHRELFGAQGIDREDIYDNTLLVADMVEEIPLRRGENVLPTVVANPYDELERKVRGQLRERHANDPKYADRLETELAVIKNKNFASYFLMVEDMIQWARSQGILVGPGRGSAAGSLVCFYLDITQVDPLEYGLLMERFIDYSRDDMPDIDVDFDARRRPEVKEYMADKYKHVASIATFNTFQGKMAIKDAARALAVPLSDVNRALKNNDAPPRADYFQFFDESDQGREFSSKYPDAIKLAKALHGRIRQMGMHAAGLVISDRPISDLAPLQTATDTTSPDGSRALYVACDLEEAADLGFIKMDLLGLKNLTVIQDTLDMIKDRHGVAIDLLKLPLDDDKVYKMLASGYTKGVFQAEGGTFTKWILDSGKCDEFSDLVAGTAIARPGPLTTVGEVYKSRIGKNFRVPNELERRIVGGTNGVCIYQDQEVWTSTGPKRIRDIEIGDRVQGDTSVGVVTHKVRTGHKPIYDVTLSNGNVVRTTADHPFLTENGYIAAIDAVGMLSASPARSVCDGNVSAPERARTLAALISEGHLPRRSSFTVANNDDAILSQLEKDVAAFDNVSTRRYFNTRSWYLSYAKADRHIGGYHSPSSLKSFIRELGLEGKTSRTKFIPSWVYTLDSNSRAAFVGMYISGDGHVSPNRVDIRTVSKRIASGMVDLLATLGVYSTFAFDGKAYTVFIKDFDGYNSVIRPHVIGKKREVTVTAESKRGKAPNVLRDKWIESGLPQREFFSRVGVARSMLRHDGPIARNVADRAGYSNPDIVWNTIVSVEPAGFDGAVYDITVEGPHSFTIGQAIVHNCIYQEQVMRYMTEIGGMTGSEANKVRSIIGKKKDPALFEPYRIAFIEGAAPKIGTSRAAKLWKDFEAHAGYSFNLSHSVVYSMVTYWTAWLKVNYSLEYMTALLRNEKKPEAFTNYLIEARRLGLQVFLPHVNKSDIDVSIQNEGIMLGLANIKYISDMAAPKIIALRPFRSFQHLREAVAMKGSGVNARMLDAMNKVGAASFADNPRNLERELEYYYEYLKIPKFKVSDIPLAAMKKFRDLEEYDDTTTFPILAMAREIKRGPTWARVDFVDETGSAGIFTGANTQVESGQMYAVLVSQNRIVRYATVEEISSGEGGSFYEWLVEENASVPDDTLKVVCFKARKTKAGKNMADVVVQDDTGELFNVKVFPQMYMQALANCKEGAIIKASVAETTDGALYFERF